MRRTFAALLVAAGVAAPAALGAGLSPALFQPLTPCRLLDTRLPAGPLGAPSLQPGVPRSFPLAGVCGVPAGAVALSVNATVTNTSALGTLVIFASDLATPGTSNLSFGAHQTRASESILGLAADGSIKAVALGASADFILDVSGYFFVPDATPPTVTLDAVPDQTIPTNTTLSLRLAGHSTDAAAALTYDLLGGPSGASVSPLGVFAFSPKQAQLGAASATVRVRDGGGRSAQRTFQIAITDHDHAPVLGPLPDDVTSVGAAYTKTLTATDPDSGDVLTFSLVSGPAGMTLSGGTLSWSPTSAQTGSWPVRVRVTDKAGLWASGLFNVAIPLLLAKDDAYSVNLGKTLTAAAPGVLANDTDPLPGPPTAVKLSDPDKGALTSFNANGSFVFQPPSTLDPVVFSPKGKFAHASGGYFNGGALIADLDGDGKPDILIQALLGSGNFGIRAIRGTDGSVLWQTASMPAPASDCLPGQLVGGRQYFLAAGDIDDSGHVSVVFPTTCGRDAAGFGGFAGTIVARYAALDGRDGSLKWLSAPLGKARDSNGNPDNLAFGTVPTIARVRAGETPSILVGKDVSFFNFAGKPQCDQAVPGWPGGPCRAIFVLDGKDGSVRQSMAVWHPGTTAPDVTNYPNGYLPAVAADLDGDGSVEFVFGGAVFNNDGSVRSNRQDASTRYMTNWVALGNFDDTPDIEIVRVEGFSPHTDSPRVSVSKANGTVLWATPIWNGVIGPLVVADVDGTGRPSVVFTAYNTVCAIGYDGVYKWCHDGGFTNGNPKFPLWTRPQVFDLDGDGVPEVIVQVNPESLLYLDGKTGNVKALEDLHAELGSPTSTYDGTYLGGPLVADLDGTGHAAIVSLWSGGVTPDRVDVVTAQTGGWSLARGIFNQAAYQFGSVNANGSIPASFQNAFATPATNVFGTQAPLAPADARKKSTTSFTYAAHDGALVSSPATVNIEILPPNRPPVFVSKPPTRFVPNTGLTYAASAVDPDPGDTVAYAVVTNQGSGSCTIGGSTGVLTCPSLGGGEHSIVLSATDPFGGIGYQTLFLTQSAGPAAVPDVVGQLKGDAAGTLSAAGFSAGAVSSIAHSAPAGQVVQQNPAAGTQALLGSSVDLVVSKGPAVTPPPGPPPNLGDIRRIVVTPAVSRHVTGDNVPFVATSVNADGTGGDITAFVTWSSSATGVATVNAAGVAHAAGAGTAAITATANGLSGQALLTVAARTNGDVTPPVAAITQPAGGGTVTGLTQVLGTASDANFVRYELALEASGGSTFTTFAQGTAPVVNGVLGTLDPTLLLNGAYTLRLTVFDANGNTATVDAAFVVDGFQKVGNFTLSFTDMTVPLAGIPIQITRTYDSRDKGTGDFGTGWRLGIQALRVSASGSQGSSWYVGQQGFSFVLIPGSDHFVSVTLPNGRVETFDLRVSPTASPFVPFTTLTATFVPRAGTLGHLTSLDNVNLLIIDPQPGPVTLVDDTTLATFHPDRFLYTQPDGTQFVVRRTTGMESIADANGNKITLTAGGIAHSSGVSIPFTRDGAGRITSIADPKGATRTYAYSATGDLVAATDRTGNTSHYFYDAAHGLVRVEDALGRAGVRCTYDDAGRLLSITDGAGGTTTYTHDLPGRAEQIVDALGRTTIVAYDDQGNALSSTDPLGHTTSFTYDAANNPLSRTSPLGATTTFEWDGSNNLLKTTDTLGRSTTFTRDSAGRPLTTTDGRGHTSTSTYDAQGNVTDTVDRLDGARHYGRDAAGNVTDLTTPTGATSHNAYDIAGRRTTLTDPLGGATHFQWDGNGQLVAQTPPGGAPTALTYDGDGRIKLHTVGALQRAFTYDAIGQVASMTSPTGASSGVAFDDAGRFASASGAGGTAVLTQTFDAVGNTLTAAGPLGLAETRAYDGANRLVSKTRADGTTETRAYDADGRLTSITDALGKTTTYAYDLAGQLQSSMNALGGTGGYAYDANGNLTSESDANGHTTLHAYDAENREILTTYADGRTTATAYDADGRVSSRTDASGGVTAFTYDAAGRLLTVTDPLGHVTAHAWAPSGVRLSTTDANGNITAYTYDALGRILTTTRPLGGVETRTYDATGRLATLTNAAAETLTRVYDAQGRQVKTLRPGGLTESYTYTPDQLADSVRDASGTTVFLWEPLTRRLSRVSQPDGRYVRYAYDAMGNRTVVAAGDQSGERVTTYAYDALGRVTSIHDPDGGTTTQTWDAVGNLLAVARPNGVTTTTTYDVRNRPVLIVSRNAANALLQQHAYTLDARGNRTRIDAFDGSHVDYTYDALSRLTREKHFAAASVLQLDLVYGYDAVGNLVSSGPAASPATFGFDADDRLVSGGGVTYTYDLVGRRTKESFLQGGNPVTRTYAWAAGDRLTSFTDTTAATTTYAYDGADLRTGKSGATGPVTFLADRIDPSGVPQLVRETTLSGTSTFLRSGSLLEAVEAGTPRYHLFDGLGSTRFLASSAGLVTDAFDYTAYGKLLSHTGSSAVPHRFAGEEYDAESGLVYLRARYFDPATGAFLSRDPEPGDPSDPITLHPYLYAAGNPVNRTDPTGRETLAEVLVTSNEQLRVQGQNVLAVRRGLAKAEQVVAETLRVDGGILAVEAFLEAVQDSTRVTTWFGGGKAGKMLGRLLTGGSDIVGEAIDVAAEVLMAKVAFDMLGGKTINIGIQGIGFLTSSTVSATTTLQGSTVSGGCSASNAFAFAYKDATPPGLELCTDFFKLPLMPSVETLSNSGRPSAAGVMIHEFTHITLRTRDHSYGCYVTRAGSSVKDITWKYVQRNLPGANLFNADTYRCWAEDTYVQYTDSPWKLP